MQELIDRIEALEHSVRRWRTATFVLVALLLSLLTTGVTLFVIRHGEALRAADEAQMRAVMQRDLAEAARLEAIRLEAAKKE